MLSLWKKVIPDELADLHDIMADSDFFNVGGSSMLLIELQTLIRDELSLSLSLIQLFQASTLRPMSRLLALEEVENDDNIDWNEETAPHPELQFERSQPDARTRMAPRVIVLTGAFTGSSH
jgi:hybrid polyketide synthase/nonribosomal peptide synthetase ACE1